MRIVWNAVRLLPARCGQRTAMQYAVVGNEVPINDMAALAFCVHCEAKDKVVLAKVRQSAVGPVLAARL